MREICKDYFGMFVPEYTITAKTLKNISLLEYSKAIIENTVVLPAWERQMQNQSMIEEIYSNLQLEGVNVSTDQIKKNIDSPTNSPKEIYGATASFELSREIGKHHEINEQDIKQISKALSSQENYRSPAIKNKTLPEEILADMVELFDWINSIDARDSHPVLVAGIAKARLEAITPFENYNSFIANVLASTALLSQNYSLRSMVTFSNYFSRGKKEYFDFIRSLSTADNDFTQWLEYFTTAVSTQASLVQEKIKLLAKDTKLAKVAGHTRLTQRQEKIVEYLQDFGILQNKDFPKLFPDKSEDSILRDIKTLTGMGLVQKSGSTKSSLYELK